MKVQIVEQSSCGRRKLQLSEMRLSNGEEVTENRKAKVNQVEGGNKMMEHLPLKKGRSEGSIKKRMDITLYKAQKQDQENSVCRGAG